jgi:hypothetical protein
MTRRGTSIASCLVACLLQLGCAETIRQTAKEAAPAAVEGGVKEAHDPTTRERVAEVLADPEIRGAAAELSQSVADGVMNSLTEEERIDRIAHMTDALVERAGSAFARSLQKDIAPQVAAMVADAVERSFDENAEQRAQAMARSVVRGSFQGAGEALTDGSGRPSPELRAAMGELAREMTHDAALGFQDAVRESTEARKTGPKQDGQVLAVAGRATDLVLGGVSSAWWALIAFGVALVAGFCIALFRIRSQREENRELRALLRERRESPSLHGSTAYAR